MIYKKRNNQKQNNDSKVMQYVRQQELEGGLDIWRKQPSRIIKLGSIKVLHIIYIDVDIIKQFRQQIPNLTNLILYLEYRIESQAIKQIASSLNYLSQFTLRSLSKNQIRFNILDYLDIVIANIKQPSKVDLSFTKITQKIGFKINQYLNKTKKLDLINCSLNDDLLIPMITGMNYLKYLNLSYNTQITNKCCLCLSLVPKLQQLNLNIAQIQNKGAIILSKSKSLKQIDLSGTLITQYIKQRLKKNKKTVIPKSKTFSLFYD